MSESYKGIYEVNKWTYKIEEALQKHGQPLGKLQKLLKELQTSGKLEKMREQENIEEQRKQKRYRGELEIEEMKLNMKREYEKKKEE